MSDLIERLRAASLDHNAWKWGWLAEACDELERLRADAERYRWLRQHRYKHRSPNTEYDNSMMLSFHVSGVWSDNMDPRVLDGCIDAAMKEQSND